MEGHVIILSSTHGDSLVPVASEWYVRFGVSGAVARTAITALQETIEE